MQNSYLPSIGSLDSSYSIKILSLSLSLFLSLCISLSLSVFFLLQNQSKISSWTQRSSSRICNRGLSAILHNDRIWKKKNLKRAGINFNLKMRIKLLVSKYTKQEIIHFFSQLHRAFLCYQIFYMSNWCTTKLFKMLKFTLRYTINAPTRFGLTKPSSGSLQSVLR